MTIFYVGRWALRRSKTYNKTPKLCSARRSSSPGLDKGSKLRSERFAKDMSSTCSIIRSSASWGTIHRSYGIPQFSRTTHLHLLDARLKRLLLSRLKREGIILKSCYIRHGSLAFIECMIYVTGIIIVTDGAFGGRRICLENLKEVAELLTKWSTLSFTHRGWPTIDDFLHHRSSASRRTECLDRLNCQCLYQYCLYRINGHHACLRPFAVVYNSWIMWLKISDAYRDETALLHTTHP